MARNKRLEERIKMLVAEVLAEEEFEAPVGRQENINDIEGAMIRIGDLVAREVGVQKLARHTGPAPEHPPCPDCGQAGEHVGEHARQLITRRGKVPLTEAKYRCPKCRRLFFPQTRALGLEAKYDYTPGMYRRIVFASAQAVSFQDASEALSELGELKLLPKRVWRAVKRIGQERVEECREAAQRYLQLSLPARREAPAGQSAPEVACVQMDGGRFQERPRITEEAAESDTATPEQEQDSGGENFWREYKAGVLLSMKSQTYTEDPCPELPATFADPGKMREMAREIKGFTTREAPCPHSAEEAAEADFKKRAGRPETLVKSVVATSGDVESFGPQLASAAHARGFHAAQRKAFVADGSATNWSVWSKYFSHYTPILDFVHALMYVYAAAMAGRSAHEGWAIYRQWAQWLWSGNVSRLLEALATRQQELGLPDKHETGTPRAQVACSLGYLSNQRQRMKYDQYRKQGLPLTSSAIESTIKQINRRIKGSEKFWSAGADPILHLVADRLSQTNATVDFWSRRVDRLVASASYQQAA